MSFSNIDSCFLFFFKLHSDGMARQAVGSYSAPGQSKVTRDDLDAAIEGELNNMISFFSL